MGLSGDMEENHITTRKYKIVEYASDSGYPPARSLSENRLLEAINRVVFPLLTHFYQELEARTSLEMQLLMDQKSPHRQLTLKRSCP